MTSQSSMTSKQESPALSSDDEFFENLDTIRNTCPGCFGKLTRILDTKVETTNYVVLCNKCGLQEQHVTSFDLAIYQLNKKYEREHNINQSHHEPTSDQ